MVVGLPQGVFLVALILSRTFALPQQPAVSGYDVSDNEYDDGPDNIFIRQTRKHARPMFYINCGYRDLCYCYSKITRHHYCCSCEVGACFPGSAKVANPTGGYTQMDQLKTGDEVLAVDDGKVVTTSVIGFMDRRPKERSFYVTLHTAVGKNLTLSPNHVLFKSAPNSSYPVSAFGSDISVGDVIFSVNKTGLEKTHVIAIEHNVIQGAYVPLTREGTLVVDGTLTSCYASYHHSLAHNFLAPARAFPILLWPRPGSFTNLSVFIGNVLKGITESSFKLVKNLFCVTRDIMCGKNYWLTGSKEVQTNKNHNSILDSPNILQSDTFVQTKAIEEGEGEAYYITLIKIIGHLLFQEEKASPQVIQVNPQPPLSGISRICTFATSVADWHTVLGMVPRSW